MMEMVEVDPETGEEDQLLRTGTMEQLSERAAEIVEQVTDAGGDIPWLRIQPAK